MFNFVHIRDSSVTMNWRRNLDVQLSKDVSTKNVITVNFKYNNAPFHHIIIFLFTSILFLLTRHGNVAVQRDR